MSKLNYRCENGHEWKSRKWPTSVWHEILPAMLTGEVKERATRCPRCGSTILMCISEDGKQGAVHMGFKDVEK